MKKLILSIIVCCVVCVTATAQTKYKLDPKKSKAQWQGYSAVNDYAPKGSIDFQRGNLEVNSGRYKGQVVLNTRSISYKDDQNLEKHLKNEDFFYVKKHPTAIFKLQSLEEGIAKGVIIIRGITQPVSLKVVLADAGKSLLITGKIRIDRTKHGIKYNSKSFFQDLGNYAIEDYFDLNVSMLFVQ